MRKKKQTSWWGWQHLAVLLFTLFLLMFVVLPIIFSRLAKDVASLPSGIKAYLEFVEFVLTYAMVVFFAIWTFFVGSTFASFLNVVAWRVPRGNSILGSSHCPFCNLKLTFRDNLPIWGWIYNQGRCSKCRLPISRRYLVVEIILGAIFLCATLTLLLTNGYVVPFVDRPFGSTVNRLLFDPEPFLVHILLLHLAAFMSIFTFALVEFEGKRIPSTIPAVSGVVLLAVVSTWPTSLVVPWWFGLTDVDWPMDRLDALATFGVGALFGFCTGLILAFISNAKLSDEDGVIRRAQLHYGFGVVGMIAGWQAVVVIGLLYLGSYILFLSNRLPNAHEKTAILSLPHVRVMLISLVFFATWRWFEILG